VYEPVDENDNERRNQIKQSFVIDNIKNENGDIIIPQNMMLHNGESNLIFTDANDSTQIYNFNLETGKVVE